MGKWFVVAVFGLFVLFTGSGCIFGVYSKQDYGPGATAMAVSQDQSLADVMKNMGAPDKIFEVGNTKILVYSQYEGMQVLGLYGNFRKKDIIVMLENNKVSQPPIMVPKGEAMTILGVINTPVMGPVINKED